MLLSDLLKRSRNAPLKTKVIVRVGIAMAATYCILILGSVLYDQSIEPEYKAVARFKISSAEKDNPDFDEQIAAMQSNEIIRRTIKRLMAEERRAIFAPYQKAGFFYGVPSEEEIIQRHRTLRPERDRFMVTIEYTHPDENLAKKLVAYFGEEIGRDMEEKSAEKSSSASNQVTERLLSEIQRIRKDIMRLVGAKKALLAQNRPVAEIESVEHEIKNKDELCNRMLWQYEAEKSHRGSWMQSSPIRWIDYPSTDDRPVNKNRPRAVGMAAGVATLISAALAFATFRMLRHAREISN